MEFGEKMLENIDLLRFLFVSASPCFVPLK